MPDPITQFLRAELLPDGYRDTVSELHEPLVRYLVRRARRAESLVVGVCGPPGSGKSTLTASLKILLESKRLSVAVLSLDDLYLTRAERTRLALEVHPLLQTRGVPGTHDVILGLKTLESLRQRALTSMPSFDKGRDDRKPETEWPRVQGPVRVILLEGWCVGVRAQDEGALEVPVNALEREEDSNAIWRHYVNEALMKHYRSLFEQIDTLVFLQAPNFSQVARWRLEQEEKLQARLCASGEDTSRVMNAVQIARFVAHYERLTRHLLDEMPSRADVLLRMNSDREMIWVSDRIEDEDDERCPGTESTDVAR